MREAVKHSKIMPVIAALCMAAVIICYFVMSRGSIDNNIFCAESVVSLGAGIIFAIGMRAVLVGKRKYIGVITCCISVLLPILVTPYLLIRYTKTPYMLQVVMYAKRMFTLFCPFLAIELLKRLVHFANRRKIYFEWVVVFYYLVSFSVIALVQHAKVWQYDVQFGYRITWEAAETFYWAAVVNTILFLYMASIPQLPKKRYMTLAAFINILALSKLSYQSIHIYHMISNFTRDFSKYGLIYALRESEWLQYRFELLSNVVKGSYPVGVITGKRRCMHRLIILWREEPLVCIRLTYGWAAVLGTVILFALLIGVLFFMKYENKDAERVGMVIKCSFVGLCCLSFASQMLLPADQLIMPLMGQGSVVIFMMAIYLALPKIFTDDIYLRRMLKSFGKTRRLTVDERHLCEIFDI